MQKNHSFVIYQFLKCTVNYLHDNDLLEAPLKLKNSASTSYATDHNADLAIDAHTDKETEPSYFTLGPEANAGEAEIDTGFGHWKASFAKESQYVSVVEVTSSSDKTDANYKNLAGANIFITHDGLKPKTQAEARLGQYCGTIPKKDDIQPNQKIQIPCVKIL